MLKIWNINDFILGSIIMEKWNVFFGELHESEINMAMRNGYYYYLVLMRVPCTQLSEVNDYAAIFSKNYCHSFIYQMN